MLDRSLTYHLSSITEDGIGSANHVFETRFGWSVRELRVLRLVRASPGITFTTLSTMTKFERSLTSRVLSKLIKAGLIRRENSPDDARIFTLTTTSHGEALCLQADPLTAELEQLMMLPLSAKERDVFMSMVSRMKDWVQDGYVQEIASRYPELGGGSPRKRRTEK